MPTATCTECRKRYVARSKEHAKDPDRLCPACYRRLSGSFFTLDMVTTPSPDETTSRDRPEELHENMQIMR